MDTFHICGRADHKLNRDSAHRCGGASPHNVDEISERGDLISVDYNGISDISMMIYGFDYVPVFPMNGLH